MLVWAAFSGKAYAQLTVTGRVTDAVTGQPLKRTNVSLAGENRGVGTNRNGTYQWKLPPAQSGWLKFTHIGYTPDSVAIPQTDTTLTVTINMRLVPEPQQLKAVVVSDVAPPEEVFGTTKFSVADFAFTHDNKLILLAYDRGLDKDARLVLASATQEILWELPLGIEAVGLFTDYLDRTFALCEKRVFMIEHVPGSNELSLVEVPETDFYSYLYPIEDTVGTQLLWSDYRWRFPKFNYFALNPVDTTLDTLATVIDRALMRQYRFSYYYLHPRDKLLARKLARDTDASKFQIAAEMSGFTNGLYYEPLYAPLFVRQDTVMLFDHYTHKLYRFNREKQRLDSIPISYHKTRKGGKWKRELIMDEETGSVYARFEQKGHPFLQRINTQNGQAVEAVRLTHKYVEQVRVKDDYVYYVYRPFGELQQKFIYRQQIRVR